MRAASGKFLRERVKRDNQPGHAVSRFAEAEAKTHEQSESKFQQRQSFFQPLNALFSDERIHIICPLKKYNSLFFKWLVFKLNVH